MVTAIFSLFVISYFSVDRRGERDDPPPSVYTLFASCQNNSNFYRSVHTIRYMIIIFDRFYKKRSMGQLIRWFGNRESLEVAVEVLERLNHVGCRLVTEICPSLRMKDFPILSYNKEINRKKFGKVVREVEERGGKRRRGAATIVDDSSVLTSSARIEALNADLIDTYRDEDPLNPLFIIVDSGRRGNVGQVGQIVAGRRLIQNWSGKVITYPIQRSFQERVSLSESFISSHGSRKGILDRAIQTANSGYLTRRLVDSRHFQIVNLRNCCRREGLRIFPLTNQSTSYVNSTKRREG